MYFVMNVIGPQISLPPHPKKKKIIIASILNNSHNKHRILSFDSLLFLFDFSRWEDFSRPMQDMLRHSDHKGFELKKPSGSLYTFPMPDCMCKLAEARSESSNTTRLA